MASKSIAKKILSNRIVQTVLVVLLLIVAVAGTWHLSAFVNRPTEEITSDSIREEIVPITELAAYEYNFTQVLNFSSTNASLPFNLDVPFSGNRFIATIDGVATIFVDASKIEVIPHKMPDGSIWAVDISLPHAEVKDPVTVDPNTLEVLYKQDGFTNPVTSEDYNDLLKYTNELQIEKVSQSDVLNRADERVQSLIRDHLGGIYGDEVSLSFSYR